MKTLLFRKSKKFLSPRAAIVFTALVLAVLALGAWRGVFPDSFLGAAAPVIRAGGALASGVEFAAAAWADKASLVRERDALSAQLAASAETQAALQANVQDLEKQAGTRSSAPAGVLASVLVRPPVSPYDALVIDAGSAGGVAAGDLALAAGGTPVGKVESVLPHFSRVLLFSSSGVKTEALAGTARVPVMLLGTGAGSFTFSLPRTTALAPLSAGDRVYVSYDGLRPVATIGSVVDAPASASLTYLAHADINPFSLVWLTLVPYAGAFSALP